MTRAIWNDRVIAESDDCIEIENTKYFPADSIKKEFFLPSETKTNCPWKGEASYYTLKVEGLKNIDAAWFYPNPKEKAKQIKDRIAFWKGVEIT